MGDNSPLYSLGGDFMPKAKRFENLEFLLKMRLEHIERLKKPVIVIQEGIYEKDSDGGTTFTKTVSDYRTKFRNKDEVLQYGKRLNESILKEIDSDSQLRSIKADLMNKGKTEEEVINFIGKNFYDIANMRKNKFRTGEFAPIGRPKKAEEDKAQRKKADRYKLIKDITKDGKISKAEILKMSSDEIKGLSLKESQRIAYFLRRAVQNEMSYLKRVGRNNIDAVSIFLKSGSDVNVKTASINELKNYIARGRRFLSNPHLAKNYEVEMKNTVYEKIKENTGIDLKPKLTDSNIENIFWRGVRYIEREGLASVSEKKKSDVIEILDAYFSGNPIESDFDIVGYLNAYFMHIFDDMGIEFSSFEEMHDYLKDIYSENLDDFEDE